MGCSRYFALRHSPVRGHFRRIHAGGLSSPAVDRRHRFMLYEAKKWFYRNGSPELVAIADERGYGKDRCRKKVKEIQRAFPLDGVREFANYRNKVGYHYDLDFVEHLRDFGKISADSFNSVLTNYAKFSREWVVLCREVLNSAPS